MFFFGYLEFMIQYSHEEQPPLGLKKKNCETLSVDLLQISVSDIFFLWNVVALSSCSRYRLFIHLG